MNYVYITLYIIMYINIQYSKIKMLQHNVFTKINYVLSNNCVNIHILYNITRVCVIESLYFIYFLILQSGYIFDSGTLINSLEWMLICS